MLITTIRQLNTRLLSRLAVATAVIAVACGLWFSGIGQSSAASSEPAPPKGIALATSEPSPMSSMPPKAQKAISSIRGILGIDFGALHAAGNGVWIANGSAKSCVFVEDSEGIGAGCATRQNTESGRLGFWIQSTTSDTSEHVGVVPDDVDSVTAKSADGTTVDTATVERNVYRVKGQNIRALVLNGGSHGQIAISG